LLRSLSEEVQFKAEETIFARGDAADCMYLVLDGYALALVVNPNTNEQKSVSIIAEGQSFGELGLLMKQRRTATVTAGTDLKVLKLTLATLKGLEQEQSWTAALIYKKLARTLAEQLVLRDAMP
jgi:CRP-like cAMP-binding protein